jgi:hypothetical protein
MKLRACALVLAVLAATVPPSFADESAPPADKAVPSKAASTVDDFDFLIGTWTVHHRRLKERLAGSTQWEEFGGTLVMQKLMAGQVNVDDNVIDLPGGRYRAMTLRSFDPKTKQWAIWWLDGRMPHQLDPPVVGSFSAGVGTFYADDEFKGRPIRVRYLWSNITATSCRWQQAFSTDGGKTWETNWVVDFTRSGS